MNCAVMCSSEKTEVIKLGKRFWAFLHSQKNTQLPYRPKCKQES